MAADEMCADLEAIVEAQRRDGIGEQFVDGIAA